MGNTAVTVIGLGEMGRALADALITSGHPTTVWNRSAGKADDLVARGASRAATVEDAVLASPLTVVCLLDYDVTDAILRPAADALRGRTLVNLTNGTPAQAREAESWAVGHGAAYLDGGIMAIPSTVATSQAFVLYSGQKAHFDAHKETLQALGAAKYVGADAGIAALYDLALLSAMNVMFDGFFHAVAMATSHTEGNAAGFTELLVPWLTNMTQVMPAFAADVDSDAEPVLAQGLDVLLAGVRNMAQASRDAGVRADYFERSAAAMEQQLAEGITAFTAPEAVQRLRTLN
ncbi:NAD(P)-dependent oxidoreductase [Streptomyces spectabilis]|uniref:3-hydroxyisobutyrate dehydrogenase-like beta-hydroxyacid dehydrogenase n=1 Tax=Streptomyces spectabilis TaxID=68270 RepID=A0A5P2X3H4_STRST|nr:NAD(P)-binding domain-containing protein [Streptomyces spectabilis]MBB5109412.1 3-hydroxyisobutyrate dehydrogenase-like beta-hydroxyacid dehydrogenase [Streptomyces spectabilis]MCI3899925.1 NAD(P)-binding domain-containing protein [Streptomyces spectabilis]QEV57570.1 NAD(P)-dependent oxidoreductase [Streptomyces spectabilis]GGV41937.1 6-phosphogluconate dehydrogenase [Streptomyces spectabilis]